MKHFAWAIAVLLSACSPFMEANRPDTVDLTKFSSGQTRLSVLSAIGSPVASEPDGNTSCDIYKLYTHGPDAGGKGAIAVGEIAVDIFTLGLSELVFTPVEAVTKNSKHTVLFCYDVGTKLLVSVNESKSSID